MYYKKVIWKIKQVSTDPIRADRLRFSQWISCRAREARVHGFNFPVVIYSVIFWKGNITVILRRRLKTSKDRRSCDLYFSADMKYQFGKNILLVFLFGSMQPAREEQ